MVRSERRVQEKFQSFVLGVTSVKLIALASLVIVACTSSFAGNTYYVSKSSGLDSYSSTQAQSKSTPWAHLPGMASHPSYTPVAGDTFILKGCDVWTNSDLPVLWNWSGTSGSPITITVDKTWYNTTNCPSAWNRPLFDAQKATVGTINNLFRASASNATSYVTLDNIEMKGLYCAGACTFGSLAYFYGYYNTTYWTLSNLYLHGWNVVTDGNCFLVMFSNAINQDSTGSEFVSGVIDGSDATGANPSGATCYGFYPAFPSVKNSVIHDLANGIVGNASTPVEISGNLIYNIRESNAGSHPNAIETTPHGGIYYIHDNVFHDNVGESLMFGNTNETDYVWNNVWYNVLGNAPEAPQTTGQTGITFGAWNNTVVTGNGQSCFRFSGQSGGSFTSVTIQNNHCVSTSSTVADSTWAGTAATLGGNVLMTPTTATSQGYTPSQTFAYSPTASQDGTVAQGINLSSLCTGNTVGMCTATTYACAYDSSKQTVSCPGESASARPATTAWDAGAYQYSSSSNGPNPPSALTAVVQ